MENCLIFEDKIREIYRLNKTKYGRIIRNDAELYGWLISKCGVFTDYLPEMVYSILHPTESPYCANGNKRKFRTITDGWNRCDVNGCSDCLARSIDKAAKTSLERYGVVNPMQSGNIKRKVVESARANGSYDVAVEKRKKHYRDLYGADHPWQTVEGKKRHDEIMLEKYGAVNPSSISCIVEKKKQNSLEKYGHEHPISSSTIQERIKESLASKYGVINASQIPEVQDKIKKTSVERYGVEHFTQSSSVREKVKQTNFQKYGETNYNKTLVAKENNSEKRLDAFFNNLLVRVPNATPLFTREEYTGVHDGQNYNWLCNVCDNTYAANIDNGKNPRCPICFPHTISIGETEVAEYIQSLGFQVVRNSRSVIRPLEIDIFIPEKNVAIEYNGLYFHSEVSGNKSRTYHVEKTNRCMDAGIKLIQILDIEWLNNRDLVESRIKQKLGISHRIYARKCQIVTVDSQTATKFFQHNHIQGSSNGSINYGLMSSGILVALMSFGKSRYSKKAKYELMRFCSMRGVTVVGGASKLLYRFESDYGKPSIVSYCDLRWNTGEVYTSMGFNMDHKSSPNYWYHKNTGAIESRVKYQKHKLAALLPNFNPELSEWENMKLNGFDRIWDCGNAVFLKNVK